MNLSTTPVRLRGDLSICVRHANGRVKHRFAIRNTITYDGLNSPLYLWAPDAITLADYAMAQLRAGESGVPPTRGDVGLGAPFGGAVITLLAVNRTRSPATGEVVITGQFDTTQANGANLTEAGVFLGNGTLFARQVHPTIPKTNLITVSYTWRFAVTA